MSFDHLPRHEDLEGRMDTLRSFLGPSTLWSIAEQQTQGRGEEPRRQRFHDLMWLLGHIEPKPKDEKP